MTEKLRVKMWESLDSFLVGVLKPYQQKRVAESDISVKQLHAQCDHEIRLFNETGNPVELSRINESSGLASKKERVDPIFAIQDIDKPYLEFHLRQLRVNQENLISALMIADTVLKESNTTKESSENVENDWIYRWQKYASEVSNRDMQQLWGRILANEYIEPNRYSLRVLEFLKTLSKKEAELISRVGKFSADGAIFNCSGDALYNSGVTFSDLVHLESIGVLANTNFSSIKAHIKASDGDQTFRHVFVSFDVSILVEHDDINKKISPSIILFTQLGKDLLSLADITADKENVDSIVKYLTSLGFSVSLSRTSITIDNQGS